MGHATQVPVARLKMVKQTRLHPEREKHQGMFSLFGQGLDT